VDDPIGRATGCGEVELAVELPVKTIVLSFLLLRNNK